MLNYEKAKVPMFDGDQENFDWWEIQWKAFAQVESLVSSLWKQLEQNRKGWDNKQRGEIGSEGQSSGNGLPSIGTEAYGVVAFVNKSSDNKMARGRSVEGHEAETGHLPAKWCAVDCRRKVQACKYQDGCRWKSKYTVFSKLSTLEHAYSNTQGHLTDNNMISAIFAIAPEKYRAMLNVTAENHGATL